MSNTDVVGIAPFGSDDGVVYYEEKIGSKGDITKENMCRLRDEEDEDMESVGSEGETTESEANGPKPYAKLRRFGQEGADAGSDKMDLKDGEDEEISSGKKKNDGEANKMPKNAKSKPAQNIRKRKAEGPPMQDADIAAFWKGRTKSQIAQLLDYDRVPEAVQNVMAVQLIKWQTVILKASVDSGAKEFGAGQASANYPESTTVTDTRMKHRKSSMKAPTSEVEPGSRHHIELLADQHGQGLLESKFQDDVSFVHRSITLFHPLSEMLVADLQVLLEDYVLPIQIQKENHTGMDIPENIWQNASLLHYTRSANKWLPVMRKLSYVRLAEHVNNAEKILTGTGNPINVAKKAAYSEYIKACYTSHAAYLAAEMTGQDKKERSLLAKEKMQGGKYSYLVEKFGIGALLIWPTELDSKPSIGDWSICRMRTLVDSISAVDLAGGGELLSLTKFISGWLEKLLFGTISIQTVKKMMHTYRVKHGISTVDTAIEEEKPSCDEVIEGVINSLPSQIARQPPLVKGRMS